MTDRVAVYIDFDNVVISRYDSAHGTGAWRKDQARDHRRDPDSADPVDVRLAEGEIDVGAIIDYAASFGTVALSRAYADWSVPANAAYKAPLVSWSIDLVQLFTMSGTKNGADIRLAVDAVEDLVRHPDITHVVFVAGDSDYVPLAQRCKRLGRYVVGIGVAGSTGRALVSACDEFIDYADLPGVAPLKPTKAKTAAPPEKKAAKKATAKKASKKADPAAVTAPAESPAEAEATALLVRAVRVGLQKSDGEWVYAAGVKSQMQRMNPAFKEKTLGFSTFRAFVESRATAVESRVDDNGQLVVRLP
jgi:hypothetical protein